MSPRSREYESVVPGKSQFRREAIQLAIFLPLRRSESKKRRPVWKNDGPFLLNFLPSMISNRPMSSGAFDENVQRQQKRRSIILLDPTLFCTIRL